MEMVVGDGENDESVVVVDTRAGNFFICAFTSATAFARSSLVMLVCVSESKYAAIYIG